MSVGSPVDERGVEEALAGIGLTVDRGDLIDGPFIPDGTVRICDRGASVLAEGRTLEEAVGNLPDGLRGRAGL